MDHVNEMRQLRCQQGLCANKTDELLSTSYHQTVEHIPNLYYIPREQSRGANNRTHSARLRLYPTYRVLVCANPWQKKIQKSWSPTGLRCVPNFDKLLFSPAINLGDVQNFINHRCQEDFLHRAPSHVISYNMSNIYLSKFGHLVELSILWLGRDTWERGLWGMLTLSVLFWAAFRSRMFWTA